MSKASMAFELYLRYAFCKTLRALLPVDHTQGW
jgi:hypothetical protein